jgi:hypothetical protein
VKKIPVIAGVATVALGLSVPAVLIATESADGLAGRFARSADDLERTVQCGRALVELSVDRERAGFEIDGDVDEARPGSRWKVVIRHDGDKVLSRTLTADAEGDLDVESRRPNTAGDDVFKLRVKNLASDRVCSVTVKTR